MEKINLDDYFLKSDSETKVQICNSTEEIAETEEFNKKMRKVIRDYKYRAVKSWQSARKTILRD